MAKAQAGFTGDDEKLTEQEKRLISAMRDKFASVPGGLDTRSTGLLGEPDQEADVQTARTNRAVREALDKLRRLESVAEDKIFRRARETREGADLSESNPRDRAGTDEAMRVIERLLTEQSQGVRRGTKDE